MELAGRTLGLPRLLPMDVPIGALRPHFNTLLSPLGTEGLENSARLGIAVHSLVAELLVASYG